MLLVFSLLFLGVLGALLVWLLLAASKTIPRDPSIPSASSAEAAEERRVAMVMCLGNGHNAVQDLEYHGVHSCKMATQLFGGAKACAYGCIGYGDCVAVCPAEAIFLCDGVARINPDRCIACRACADICPRDLIDFMPIGVSRAAVLCKNQSEGEQTAADCKAGCTGCGECVKVCPTGAVAIRENCAAVDPEKCTGCGACTKACPGGVPDLYSLKGNVNA